MSGSHATRGDRVSQVWMIIQLTDGTQLGYEIGPAEVEFRYDADIEPVGPFTHVMRPINKRWSWTITTFHGFRMYTPGAGNFSTGQPQLEAARSRLAAPVPPALEATRE